MTGPIGHGKTTLANAVAELVPQTVRFESSSIVSEIANAWHATLKEPFDPYDLDALNNWVKRLPEILENKLQVHCTFEKLKIEAKAIEYHPIEYQKLLLHAENLQRDFTMAKHDITADNKEAYRPLLQWLGGYLVNRVNPGIWYNEIVRRVKLAEESGAELCIVGGLRFPEDADILRKAGGIIIKVYRPGHLQNDMLDPTERERDDIVVDTTILSNGTIDDIKPFAKKFLEDIRNNTIQHTYQTRL